MLDEIGGDFHQLGVVVHDCTVLVKTHTSLVVAHDQTDLFEDLEGRLVDGADLFQAEIRQVEVPALEPGASGTITIGAELVGRFTFLSAAYSDQLQVRLLLADDNLANNEKKLPLAVEPSLSTALRCIGEIATIALAPAAVGALGAVSLGALAVDGPANEFETRAADIAVRRGGGGGVSILHGVQSWVKCEAG